MIKHVKLFEEFMSGKPTFKIELYRSVEDIVKNALLRFKKIQHVKTPKIQVDAKFEISDHYAAYWGTYAIKFRDNKVLYVAQMHPSHPKDSRPSVTKLLDQYILVYSESEINLKLIEEIFPDAIGVYANSEYVLTSSVESTDIPNVENEYGKESGSFDNKVCKYFYIVKYTVKENAVPVISAEEIMKMPEYKNMLEQTGLELVNKPHEKKTFIFSFPIAYSQPEPDKDEEYEDSINGTYKKKKLTHHKNGISMYGGSGYIRTEYLYDSRQRMTAPIVDNFDPSSLEGWKKGFEKVMIQWRKRKSKYFTSAGIHLIDTPEERYEKRGQLSAKSFGI